MEITYKRFTEINSEAVPFSGLNTPFIQAIFDWFEETNKKGGIEREYTKKRKSILYKTSATDPKKGGAFFTYAQIDNQGNKLLDQHGQPIMIIDYTPTPEKMELRDELFSALNEEEVFKVDVDIQIEIPVLTESQIKAFEGIFIPMGYKNPPVLGVSVTEKEGKVVPSTVAKKASKKVK